LSLAFKTNMRSKLALGGVLLSFVALLPFSQASAILRRLSQCEAATQTWTRNVDLIDTSNAFASDMPTNGWHVAPVHTTLLDNGKVFIVGWNRKDYINCVKPDGSRKHGVSFVIDVEDIVKAGSGQVDALRGLPNPTYIVSQPFDDKKKAVEDELYCSGQVTLDDGRVWAVGGATYKNLGTANEVENGIDYGRMFDPVANSISLTSQSPIGNMWYPTAAKLPGGDVLVTGGFYRYTLIDAGDANANDNVAIYHPATDSWTRLGSVPDNLITPGVKDYTHIWQLPHPIKVNGLDRHVAMAGYKGTLVFYNTDPSTPEGDRPVQAPNPNRPSGGAAWDTSALLAPTGEFFMVGGGNAPDMIDMYDPIKGTWRSIQTGVKRDNGASVLLPDGTILLINGQDRTDWNIVPAPQIFDPWTGSIKTLPQWDGDNASRAYHSIALLLKDGRVLLGGGIDGKGHEIACERTDMRLFTPPYLQGSSNGSSCVQRPTIKAASDKAIEFTVHKDGKNSGSITTVAFDGPAPRKTRGASLMALGSFTHAFDQNQRYVPLKIVAQRPGQLDLAIEDAQVPIGGLYNLFLIAEDGTPSVGVSARINVV
jgi:hypothetical protein